jgi:hypothetical protein
MPPARTTKAAFVVLDAEDEDRADLLRGVEVREHEPAVLPLCAGLRRDLHVDREVAEPAIEQEAFVLCRRRVAHAERVRRHVAGVRPGEAIERRVSQRGLRVAGEDVDRAPGELTVLDVREGGAALWRGIREGAIEGRVTLALVRRRPETPDRRIPLREDPLRKAHPDRRRQRTVRIEVGDRGLHLHLRWRRELLATTVVDERGQVLFLVLQAALHRPVGADDDGVGAPLVDTKARAWIGRPGAARIDGVRREHRRNRVAAGSRRGRRRGRRNGRLSAASDARGREKNEPDDADHKLGYHVHDLRASVTAHRVPPAFGTHLRTHSTPPSDELPVSNLSYRFELPFCNPCCERQTRAPQEGAQRASSSEARP